LNPAGAISGLGFQASSGFVSRGNFVLPHFWEDPAKESFKVRGDHFILL